MCPSEDKKTKNLLVLCHSYMAFQKDLTETVAPNFSSVNALVRVNPFADIGKNISCLNLGSYSTQSKMDTNNLPNNTHVYSTYVWYFPTERGYKNLGDKHLVSVEAQIQKHQIETDLIHAHFTWSSGYVGAKLKQRLGVPLVITSHGYDIYWLPFRDAIWRKKIEDVLNTADAIITVSKSNYECIRKLEINTPVKIIPNGFRKDLFYPRDTMQCRQLLHLPLDKKILLTIGYLYFADKGQNYLVEALDKIIQEEEDIFCIIIGRGKDQRLLEKQIRSFGLEDHIMLAGGKIHSEIPIWINACDVFVLPSLNEGVPTVMFECLGCGKPFVGTYVGGMPEVIISGEYGLLAEPANSSELGQKILTALDREWDRKKIIAYAERFTWDALGQETMKVYSRVLGYE